MTQATLTFTDDHPSLTDVVQRYFIAHPDEWIDFRVLAKIGGTGGFRTRISDCRLQRGMRIANRQRRERGYTISEYRYEPE